MPPTGGAPAPDGSPDAAEPSVDPVDLARSEGASPIMVGGLARTLPHIPGWAMGTVGFAVAVHGRFGRHRGPVLAGGLAFFAMLSLVPALLSVTSVAALVIDPATIAEAADRLLVNNPEAAAALEPVVDAAVHAAGLGSAGVLAALAGLVVSLYAASRFLYVGHQVLDIAFDSEPQPPSVLHRVIAIGITVVLQVAFVLVLVVLGLVPRVLEFLGVAAGAEQAIRTLRQPLLLVVVYLLLTAAMRHSAWPRRPVGWLNPGAALGTLIVLVGTFGLSSFIGFSRTYGQIVSLLGGVIAIELWLYVVGLAIVVSAETEGVRARVRLESAQQPVAGGGPPRDESDPGRAPAL